MGLKEMFKSMDTDNNGIITYEELKAGLPKLGTKLSESEVRQLMEAVMSLVFLLLMVPELHVIKLLLSQKYTKNSLVGLASSLPLHFTHCCT